VLALDPMMGRGLSKAQTFQLYDQLLERVRMIPGTETVGLGQHVPLGISDSATDVAIEGYTMPEGQRYLPVLYRMIVFQGLKMSAAGTGVGIFLAGAVATTIPEMSAPADPSDPLVYAIVVAVFADGHAAGVLLPRPPRRSDRSE
jgi:hypothetical protein